MKKLINALPLISICIIIVLLFAFSREIFKYFYN